VEIASVAIFKKSAGKASHSPKLTKLPVNRGPKQSKLQQNLDGCVTHLQVFLLHLSLIGINLFSSLPSDPSDYILHPLPTELALAVIQRAIDESQALTFVLRHVSRGLKALLAASQSKQSTQTNPASNFLECCVKENAIRPIKWAIRHGAKLSEELISAATFNGNVRLILWFRKQGAPLTRPLDCASSLVLYGAYGSSLLLTLTAL